METKQTWVVKSDWVDFVNLPKTIDYTQNIYPKVLDAQDIALREAIGWDFYRELAAVLDNGNTVSGATVDGEAVSFTQGAYDALTPYLKPFIVHYAYAYHLEDTGIVETRYGTVQKQNPHSSEISEKRRDRQIHKHTGRATHYLKRIRKFLEDNASDYSKFYSVGTDAQQGTPRISSIWDAQEGNNYAGTQWESWPYRGE